MNLFDGSFRNDDCNHDSCDFVYYDVLPLTAPAHLVDPSLPPPPPAVDYADGTWTRWLRTAATRVSSGP